MYLLRKESEQGPLKGWAARELPGEGPEDVGTTRMVGASAMQVSIFCLEPSQFDGAISKYIHIAQIPARKS